MDILQILSITISLIILLSVLEFIRRGVFKEKYALLWLFSSIALIIISFWRGLLDFTAGIFGFYYPPSFLFLLGLGFLLLITLHYLPLIQCSFLKKLRNKIYRFSIIT
ncbi:MAG TPA: DUF2304 domain-containing protein [bacterium]|nr:DUF2304 domain-containing protein [bacterium]